MDNIKSALAAFAAMVVLNAVVVTLGASGFLSSLIVGGLLFIGFGATAMYVYTTFEGPPENVWLLYASYQLVVFLVMGGMFAIW